MCIYVHTYHITLAKFSHVQLYPYGLTYSDTQLPPSDDGSSSLIQLSDEFIFYNTSTRFIYVCLYSISIIVYIIMCMDIVSIHMLVYVYLHS